MNEARVSNSEQLRIADSLPFDPPPSCLIDFGLYCVAADARAAVLGVDEAHRAVEFAQLALDVEKLRREHSQYCPECTGYLIG